MLLMYHAHGFESLQDRVSGTLTHGPGVLMQPAVIIEAPDGD